MSRSNDTNDAIAMRMAAQQKRPYEQKPEPRKPAPVSEKKYDGGLIAAIDNMIYAILPGGRRKLIAERKCSVQALCFHAGRLFDGGDDRFIIDTLDNSVVAVRDSGVGGICSCGEKLYDSCYKTVQETATGSVIAERDECIFTLCSHEGRVYDGCIDGTIHDTFKDADGKKPMINRGDFVRALCSHNGKLYDGGRYSEVFETLEGRAVARRDGGVHTLCSCNSVLYDGCFRAIHETLADKHEKEPFMKVYGTVGAMAGVDAALWNKILQMDGDVE